MRAPAGRRLRPRAARRAASARRRSPARALRRAVDPSLPVPALAAVGALVVAGVLWFALRDPDPAPGATPGTAAAPAGARMRWARPRRRPTAPLDKATQGLLEQAEKAYARGELVLPADKSAAALFGQVLQKVPGQAQATAGLDKVVNALLGLAEKAILEGKLDDAARDIDSAKALQPDNVRIAFLSTQLGKERERLLLTRARAAAASGDLGKALAVLDSSARPPRSGAGLVAQARRELEAQQVTERVRELLRLGNERLRSGSLTEPASDNARFYLESARALAPREPGVARLSTALQARALADARAAASRGDATAANRAIRSASDLGVPRATSSRCAPSSPRRRPLRARRRPGASRRWSRSASARAGWSSRPTTARRAISRRCCRRPEQPDGGLAAPAARPRDAERGARRDRPRRFPGGARAGSARPRASACRRARSRRSTRTWSPRATSCSSAPRSSARARSSASARSSRPTRARPRRTTSPAGSTSSSRSLPQGSVADIRVTGSQPASVFDIAAVEALNKWRFEPVRRDGAAVEQRARLRMRFQIE
jgi:TonB family protein